MRALGFEPRKEEVVKLINDIEKEEGASFPALGRDAGVGVIGAWDSQVSSRWTSSRRLWRPSLRTRTARYVRFPCPSSGSRE